MMLADKHQYNIMVGKTVCPDDSATAAFKKKYAENNEMTYARLTIAITGMALGIVMHSISGDGAQAWVNLQQKYQPAHPSRAMML